MSVDIKAFTSAELDLIRQWFNALQDVSPQYLEAKDYDLADKVADLTGATKPRRPGQTATGPDEGRRNHDE